VKAWYPFFITTEWRFCRFWFDHAKEAVALIAGKGRAELQHDRVLELALIRMVEIVGEASVKVSSEIQAKYPSMPWPPGDRHAQPVNSLQNYSPTPESTGKCFLSLPRG